jgi:hypothetical protein
VHLAADAVVAIGLDDDVADHRAHVAERELPIAVQLDAIEQGPREQAGQRRPFVEPEREAVVRHLDEREWAKLVHAGDEEREPADVVALHRGAGIGEGQDACAEIGHRVDVRELDAPLRRVDERVGDGLAEVDDARARPRGGKAGDHRGELVAPAGHGQHVGAARDELAAHGVQVGRDPQGAAVGERTGEEAAVPLVRVVDQHPRPVPDRVADDEVAERVGLRRHPGPIVYRVRTRRKILAPADAISARTSPCRRAGRSGSCSFWSGVRRRLALHRRLPHRHRFGAARSQLRGRRHRGQDGSGSRPGWRARSR